MGVWLGVRLDEERPEPPSRAAEVAAVPQLDAAVPEVPSAPLPEVDAGPTRDGPRPWELGATTVLVSGGGLGAHALVGGAVFALVPVGELLSVRPSLGVARPTDLRGDRALLTARLDGCSNVRGRYAHLGLELALCAGLESGGVAGAAPAPFVAAGAGAAVRGDLGGPLVTELRADAFVAMARPEGDASPIGGRIALGFAWRLR